MYEIVYQEIEEKKEYEPIVKKVLTQCFKEENLENTKLSITITLTTPQNIQKVNKEYRGIDKETDVLSFPIFEKDELAQKIQKKDFTHQDILGDIIILSTGRRFEMPILIRHLGGSWQKLVNFAG